MIKVLVFLAFLFSANSNENAIEVVTKKDSYLCKIKYMGRSWDCSIGKNGTGKEKEGDMKTPSGTFEFQDLYYRADKKGLTKKELAVVKNMSKIFKHEKQNKKAIKIKENAAWGGDEDNYNQYFEFSEKDPAFIEAKAKKLNDIGNNERLWRNDRKYHVILPLSYNQENTPGLGSAIFFHIGGQNPDIKNKKELKYTAGCIAMWEDDMFELLNEIAKTKSIPTICIQ